MEAVSGRVVNSPVNGMKNAKGSWFQRTMDAVKESYDEASKTVNSYVSETIAVNVSASVDHSLEYIDKKCKSAVEAEQAFMVKYPNIVMFCSQPTMVRTFVSQRQKDVDPVTVNTVVINFD